MEKFKDCHDWVYEEISACKGQWVAAVVKLNGLFEVSDRPSYSHGKVRGFENLLCEWNVKQG